MRLRLITLTVLSVLLAGCLLLPGKFDSALDIRRDGTFHFHYAGEIVYLPLTEAARTQMKQGLNGAPGGAAHGGQSGAPDHSADHSADAMLSMLGGLSAGDPKGPEMFADALRRQAGWRKVVSKGNGVFDVEYDIGGRLDHDFTFPTLEHTPLLVPFVAVTRRADGSVHVEAPGFAPGLGNLGALGAMGGGAILPPSGGAAAGQSPLKGMPPTDGAFAVTTDGAILTNNTEDGPAPAEAGSQRLNWKIGTGHGAAPTALIRLK